MDCGLKQTRAGESYSSLFSVTAAAGQRAYSRASGRGKGRGGGGGTPTRRSPRLPLDRQPANPWSHYPPLTAAARAQLLLVVGALSGAQPAPPRPPQRPLPRCSPRLPHRSRVARCLTSHTHTHTHTLPMQPGAEVVLRRARARSGAAGDARGRQLAPRGAPTLPLARPQRTRPQKGATPAPPLPYPSPYRFPYCREGECKPQKDATPARAPPNDQGPTNRRPAPGAVTLARRGRQAVAQRFFLGMTRAWLDEL